jgi:hypothetical protein
VARMPDIWARRRRLFIRARLLIRAQKRGPFAWARRRRRPVRSGRPESLAWARRAVLAAALLAVAFVPYPVIGSASVPSAGACHGACRHSGPAGKVLWSRPLPGQWAASGGLAGTVPVSGQAYAAIGSGVAVVGLGHTIRAYGSRTGKTLWNAGLPGFPADASIVSVRTWTGVVTVGVAYGPGGASRAELVFASATGHQIRWYNAAPFGGAVAASPQVTVIVGNSAVTAYNNRTGAVRWSRPTGPSPQAWHVNGPDLYVTEAAGGYLGSAPVTALRRIDLNDGLESTVRPSAPSFPGSFSGVVDDVLLFSAASGVTAYDGLTGLRLWSIKGAVPEETDSTQQRFYLTEGTTLVGVSPLTGEVIARASGSAVAGSAGMFSVWAGVALGLDQGPNGEAWGYDVRLQRVTWTSPSLPWPHYFVDISGMGGSADAGGPAVVVADCAKLAPRTLPSAPSPGGSGSSTGPGGSAGTSPSASPSAGGTSPSASAVTGSAAPSGSAGSAGTSASASASPAPSRSGQLCQDPELVAIYR